MKRLSEGVSVLVPVYRSEAGLAALIDRIRPVLESLGTAYEAILVEDGSPDRSWDVLRRLAAGDEWIRPIRLMRNYGQHNALLCGLRAARYSVTVTLDDDLQNPPEEIPALLRSLTEDLDVVYGAPRAERHGLWRDCASRVTKLVLQRAMGARTARSVSAFRAFRTSIRDAFSSYNCPFVNLDVLLTWGTARFGVVHVRHDERPRGASTYTFRKLLTHALNMITGFSVVPLQMASLLGFGFTVFGLVVLAFVLGRYIITGTSVPGFPFLASIIAIFSGAQLFALGIIGEYLSRMYSRTMDRPPYAVRETIDAESERPGHAP